MMENVVVNVSYEAERFERLLIERAAYLLLERMQDTVEKECRARVIPIMEDKVNAIVEGVLTKRFTPTDTFGEAKGQETSLQQLIMERADKFMAEDVNSEGTKVERSHYTRSTSRAQWLMHKLYGEMFNRTVQAEVKKVADAATVQAQKAVAEFVVQQLAKAVK